MWETEAFGFTHLNQIIQTEIEMSGNGKHCLPECISLSLRQNYAVEGQGYGIIIYKCIITNKLLFFLCVTRLVEW